MLMSIGIDSNVFAREARNATRRAFAICSAVASTMPSTFFWFGQIKTQTLNTMMVPSQAPSTDPEGVGIALAQSERERVERACRDVPK